MAEALRIWGSSQSNRLRLEPYPDERGFSLRLTTRSAARKRGGGRKAHRRRWVERKAAKRGEVIENRWTRVVIAKIPSWRTSRWNLG